MIVVALVIERFPKNVVKYTKDFLSSFAPLVFVLEESMAPALASLGVEFQLMSRGIL